MLPIRPATPGRTLLFLICARVILRELHNTRDRRFYVPSEGQSIMVIKCHDWELELTL